MPELPFSLERTVIIPARRETVFRYFTDSTRFAAWWGAGSQIDARIGGRMVIRHPGGVVATGEVVEVEPGRRIVFTYGYEDTKHTIPPGGSRVTVTLEDASGWTRLSLRHDIADEKARDHHIQGWRYNLAVFSNVASAEEHAGAAARVDALFRAWGEPDTAARQRLLEESVAPDLVFRDQYSATFGLEDLQAHLAAVVIFMPGMRLARDGNLQHCQGTAIARWTATGADGAAKGRGSNVYDFAPDGRISRLIGLWEK